MLEAIEHQDSLLTNISDKWEDSSPNQKFGFATVICLILAVAIAWAMSGRTSDWRPISAGMSPSQTAEVVQKLEDMGQSYKLSADGSMVLVPAVSVHRLRLELAATGMMENGGKGFELFESASLSRSDFSERVTYLRAIQGELSNTISAVENIKKARVHLNLAKRAIFLDQKAESSAAIYVELRTGASLNQNQVKGIIHLVANSVEGLKIENVNLFDASGQLNVSGEDLDESKLSPGDSDDRSARLTKIAQAMLDRILGPGKALANVQIEIDYETRRVERESNEAGKDGKEVALHREDRSETFEGTRPKPEASGEAGGPPVEVTENAGADKPKYSQTSSNVDYAVTKTRETIEERGGGVVRMSASIIVDSAAELTDKQLKDLALGVKTAIGFNKERKDQFEIRSLPFNREQMKEIEESMAQEALQKQSEKTTILYALAGAGGLAILAAIVGFFVKRKKSRSEVWVDVDVTQEPEFQSDDDLLALEDNIDFDLLTSKEPEPEEESHEELLLRALEEVERDPEAVARLIENWIEGDKV